MSKILENPKVVNAFKIIGDLVKLLTPFLSGRDWSMRFRRETKDRLNTVEEQTHKLTQFAEQQSVINEAVSEELSDDEIKANFLRLLNEDTTFAEDIKAALTMSQKDEV